MVPAILLAAAFVPSASAVCVAGRTCGEASVTGIGDLVGGVDPIVALILNEVGPISPPTLQEVVTPDQDGDNIPDLVEAQACGRQRVHDQINGPIIEGDCVSNTDYVGPDHVGPIIALVNQVISDVEGAADFAYRQVDNDFDRVPDRLEPDICSVEDQNDDPVFDGRCEGENYFPPL